MLTNTSPALARSWIAVAHSDELGDEPMQAWVLGEPWVLVRLGGEVRAFTDRCPHRLAPLSAGTVVDGELQCGYHGWRFASDGRATAVPALGTAATLPPRACLPAAAAVSEHLGLVWIAPQAPLAPLPELPGWNEDGYVSAFCETVRTPVSAMQLIDNFMDAAHFPFVHPASFGVEDAFDVSSDEIVRDDWVVTSTFTAPYQNHDDPLVETGEHPLVQEHTVTKTGFAGCNAGLELRFPMTDGVFGIIYACQPESASSTRVFKIMARNDVDAAGMERCVKDEDAILQEDLDILERYTTMGLETDLTVEVHTKADRLRRRLAAPDEGTRILVNSTSPLGNDAAVFGVDDLDRLVDFFREHGFAVLRGLFDDDFMNAMELECVDAQHGVVEGTLPARHGSAIFLDDSGGSKSAKFANYVMYAEEVCPTVRAAIDDPTLVALMQRWLGADCWTDPERFGVVYQDARPGRESSYTRIGWHSDWQSGPNLDVWPAVAFTFHVDGTSPDNGFLRVVPGSHRWSTPAPFENVNGAVVPAGSKAAMGHTEQAPPVPMPLRFEKVPGEIAVYVERGDVIFHDAYLWHSAARATSDESTRRHVRGGYYGGVRQQEARYDEFVKNAAR